MRTSQIEALVEAGHGLMILTLNSRRIITEINLGLPYGLCQVQLDGGEVIWLTKFGRSALVPTSRDDAEHRHVALIY